MNTLLELLEDLRFPIGLLFGILSLILVFLGLTSLPEQADMPNVNLWMGLVMGAFAAFMLGLAIKGRGKKS